MSSDVLVRSGVAGLGIGEQHARAYLKRDPSSLRWLYDPDREKARRLLRELGTGRVAESFEEMVRDPETNVLSIASPDDAHGGQVVAALQAGKHVFVEKPLCRSHEELRSIRKAWEEGGRPHLRANLVLRASPLYGWLKRAIEEGMLGEIYTIDGDYLYGRLHKITQGWRSEVENYSVMQGGGIHLVDLLLWLTGRQPVSVVASGNRLCTAGTSFRYPDFVSAVFQFASGLIARITANFGSVHRHQHVVRVFGTKGTFIYDDEGARLHESRDPGSSARRIDAAPLPATKGDLIPGFVASILGREDSAVAARREFDLMEACLIADRALATGERVEFRRTESSLHS